MVASRIEIGLLARQSRLKLVVNPEKSQVARSYRVKFLGLHLVGDSIAISRKALQAQSKGHNPRVLQSIIQPHNAGMRDCKTWVTWQWLPAVREPRKREALPSRA